jgi:hypothetical protein
MPRILVVFWAGTVCLDESSRMCRNWFGIRATDPVKVRTLVRDPTATLHSIAKRYSPLTTQWSSSSHLNRQFTFPLHSKSFLMQRSSWQSNSWGRQPPATIVLRYHKADEVGNLQQLYCVIRTQCRWAVVTHGTFLRRNKGVTEQRNSEQRARPPAQFRTLYLLMAQDINNFSLQTCLLSTLRNYSISWDKAVLNTLKVARLWSTVHNYYLLLHLEEAGGTLRNVGRLSTVYTALYPGIYITFHNHNYGNRKSRIIICIITSTCTYLYNIV